MTGSLHNQTPPNEVFTVQQVLNKASGKDIWLCFNIVDPAECISSYQRWKLVWEVKAGRHRNCRRRCSVMRRWRAFCGRGLDLVHARLSPVLRQTRSQYFQRAVVPELLLRIRTLLSRRQLLIRSVPRPKKWPIRLCCLLVQTEEWPVCLCCLLVLLLCHLFHKINHLKIFFIKRWSMMVGSPFS